MLLQHVWVSPEQLPTLSNPRHQRRDGPPGPRARYEAVHDGKVDFETQLEIGQPNDGHALRSASLALARPPHTLMIVSSLVICSQQGRNVQLGRPPTRHGSARVRGDRPGASPLITTPDKIHKQDVVPNLGILCHKPTRPIHADLRP